MTDQPTITPITADDPESKSADVIQQNIEQLKALFPELITEGANGASVNVDVLKNLVGDQTVTDTEEHRCPKLYPTPRA